MFYHFPNTWSWSKLLAAEATLLGMQPPVSVCMYDENPTHKQLSPTPPTCMKPLFNILLHGDSVMTCRPVSCSSVWRYCVTSVQSSCIFYIRYSLLTFGSSLFFLPRSDVTIYKEKLFPRSAGSYWKELCRLSKEVRDLVWKRLEA